MVETTGTASRRRVAPLSPDARRAALVDATLPLLREFGMAVSTRQIAEAAGVAEGTIFRAFPDKNALLVASVIRGTTIPPDRPLRGDIDPAADLRTRLAQATEAMVASMTSLGRLPEVMRELMGHPDARDVIGARMIENRIRTMEALTEMLRPDADRLRVSLSQAARIILMMVFGANQPFVGSEALTSAEIVAVVLDGLLLPAADAA